jgi:hypothetical protein
VSAPPTVVAPETIKPFVGAAVDAEYPIAAPPLTCKIEPGVVVPIPNGPFAKTLSPVVALDAGSQFK